MTAASPAVPNPKALERLQDSLGHRFARIELLIQALTHTSAVALDRRTTGSYERLEFLGDRVLGLVVADLIHQSFPADAEGVLARRFNALVRRETCADVAIGVDLGAAMILGEAEEQSGGRNKVALLGDICEAVIAALYLDGGLPAARKFIEANWRDRLTQDTAPRRDPKTALQEWAQGGGRDLPRYRQTARSGPDHAPIFTIEVEVSGVESALGEGASKRSAEQAAARAMLEREGVWAPET